MLLKKNSYLKIILRFCGLSMMSCSVIKRRFSTFTVDYDVILKGGKVIAKKIRDGPLLLVLWHGGDAILRDIRPMLLELLIAAKFRVLQADARRYRASALTTDELITSRLALITSAIVCDVSVDKSQLNCVKRRFPLRQSSSLEKEVVEFTLNSAVC